ncbi:MAG: hypothetical protein WCO86_08705, partial [Planctomycetota bacterium]
QKKFAAVLSVSQQMVSYLLNKSEEIPYEIALKIFVYTKGRIKLEELLTNEKNKLTSLFINQILLKGSQYICDLDIITLFL